LGRGSATSDVGATRVVALATTLRPTVAGAARTARAADGGPEGGRSARVVETGGPTSVRGAARGAARLTIEAAGARPAAAAPRVICIGAAAAREAAIAAARDELGTAMLNLPETFWNRRGRLGIDRSNGVWCVCWEDRGAKKINAGHTEVCVSWGSAAARRAPSAAGSGGRPGGRAVGRAGHRTAGGGAERARRRGGLPAERARRCGGRLRLLSAERARAGARAGGDERPGTDGASDRRADRGARLDRRARLQAGASQAADAAGGGVPHVGFARTLQASGELGAPDLGGRAAERPLRQHARPESVGAQRGSEESTKLRHSLLLSSMSHEKKSLRGRRSAGRRAATTDRPICIFMGMCSTSDARPHFFCGERPKTPKRASMHTNRPRGVVMRVMPGAPAGRGGAMQLLTTGARLKAARAAAIAADARPIERARSLARPQLTARPTVESLTAPPIPPRVPPRPAPVPRAPVPHPAPLAGR